MEDFSWKLVRTFYFYNWKKLKDLISDPVTIEETNDQS